MKKRIERVALAELETARDMPRRDAIQFVRERTEEVYPAGDWLTVTDFWVTALGLKRGAMVAESDGYRYRMVPAN